MVESREAAPERSSFDAAQFNVSPSIALQFYNSCDIILVPPDGCIVSQVSVLSPAPPRPQLRGCQTDKSYETKVWFCYLNFSCIDIIDCRLSTANANIENHRFNPNISPYDSINEDIMFKKSRASDEYKKAKIYEMEKSRKKHENSFQQILNSRKESQNEIKDEYSMKAPR